MFTFNLNLPSFFYNPLDYKRVIRILTEGIITFQTTLYFATVLFYLFRCNLVGQDLNRAWADTNKFMHSEIVDIKKKLQHYDNHSAYDLGNFLHI